MLYHSPFFTQEHKFDLELSTYTQCGGCFQPVKINRLFYQRVNFVCTVPSCRLSLNCHTQDYGSCFLLAQQMTNHSLFLQESVTGSSALKKRFLFHTQAEFYIHIEYGWKALDLARNNKFKWPRESRYYSPLEACKVAET
jgi:hypothetical protein